MFFKELIIKVFLLVLSLFIISGTTYYALKERDYLTEQVDIDLKHHLLFYQELFPDEYHDKVDENFYTPSEYKKILLRNNKLCRESGLQYLWSVIKKDDGIYFTSSTTNGHDFHTGNHALFFDKHSDPESFDLVFKRMKPTYSSFNNEWGEGRQLLIPFVNDKGEKYAYGVSQSVEYIDELVWKSFQKNMLVGLAVLSIGFIISLIVFKYFSYKTQGIYSKLDNFFRSSGYLAEKETSDDIKRIEKGLDLILKSRMDFTTLLREVNHRVKNIYQFLSSFLSLSSNDIEDPKSKKIITNLKDVIQGMSLLHENIYAENYLGTIQVKEYVVSLASKLHQSFFFGENKPYLHICSYSDRDTMLSPEKNINIGMILNELMINTMKANAQSEGVLSIYLFICVDEDHVSLAYCDSGSYYTEGKILSEHKKGVGLLLIDSMIFKLGARQKNIYLKELSKMMDKDILSDYPDLSKETVAFAFSIPL